MSTRTCYSLFKGVEPHRARAAIAEAAKSQPGPRPQASRWSDWTYVIEPKQMVALACPNSLIIADDAWHLAQELARLLDAPHLELRVQESDHWDFTLYYRTKVIADFSTRVTYFDDDPAALRPWKEGDATAFGTVWNVPVENVIPYLIDWETQSDSRLAVDSDEFPIRDWRQIFDFMRIIGVDDPLSHPDRFQFDVPTWTGKYIFQPKWRRAIRRISVWIKKTYPDVPRQTPEQREHWARLRSKVSVVKSDLFGTRADE